MCPMEERLAAWQMIVDDLPVEVIDRMTTVVSITDLPALSKDILGGQTRGRVVVDVNP